MCWVNVDSVCRNAKTSAAAGKQHQRWVSKQPTELVSRNWTKWSAVISCKDSLGRCRYCFEHRLLLHPARHDRSHVLREEKLQSLPKVWWLYIKKPRPRHMRKGRRRQRHSFTSKLMQYGGCNHYCGTFKVRVFRKSGEERISCTLAGRQGAMSALIRSVCSARTDICGLWTLHNRCLSYSVLPIQHVHLIHPWGGLRSVFKDYRYYQRPVVARGTALVTAIWKLHIA